MLENAYDQTALIEAVAPADFERREVELLRLARQWMPRLPFRRVDVLLIDEIGKNFSGVGIDSNVVGRKFDEHKAVADEYPKVKRIALRGLSPQSHGNAIGIGLAEFCRSQLLRDTNFAATRLNVLTSGRVAAAMCPLDYETDREVLELGLGHRRPGRAPGRPAVVDPQHDAVGRGGMFGGLSGRGPWAQRPDDPQPTAAAAAGRGGQLAGTDGITGAAGKRQLVTRSRSWSGPCPREIR